MWSLCFNKVDCLRATTLLKKGLQHRFFPVNFAKFFRVPFLWNISGGWKLMLSLNLGNFRVNQSWADNTLWTSIHVSLSLIKFGCFYMTNPVRALYWLYSRISVKRTHHKWDTSIRRTVWLGTDCFALRSSYLRKNLYKADISIKPTLFFAPIVSAL